MAGRGAAVRSALPVGAHRSGALAGQKFATASETIALAATSAIDARPWSSLRIESIFDTLKDRLDLERHSGRTKPGVCARVLQRILALTAANWHNETTHRHGPTRSVAPNDH